MSDQRPMTDDEIVMIRAISHVPNRGLNLFLTADAHKNLRHLRKRLVDGHPTISSSESELLAQAVREMRANHEQELAREWRAFSEAERHRKKGIVGSTYAEHYPPSRATVLQKMKRQYVGP